MSRARRTDMQGDPDVYHVIFRITLPGPPFKAVGREVFFVEILGFSPMGNHFHRLDRILPEDRFTDEALVKRLHHHYGEDFHRTERRISIYYKEKLTSLANFMKEVKQAFPVYYNRCHKRKGGLWGERFKSVMVENGETLINYLADVDLHPVRAELVKKPEDYRWNSMGRHTPTGDADNFRSTDFRAREFGEKNEIERIRLYR